MEDIRAWAPKQLDSDTGLPLFTAAECQSILASDDPYRAVFGIAKQVGYMDGYQAGYFRPTKH